MLSQLPITICYCYVLVIIIMISLPCRTNSCSEVFSCGNGLPIYYPFWSRSSVNPDDGSHCGYPGFGFDCGAQFNGRPVLNISNNLYYIEDFQQGSSILIVNHDFVGKSCPRPRRNFTTVDSHAAFNPFFVDKRCTNFTYFFNCTSKPPYNDQTSLESSNFRLNCLDYNDTIRSYAYRAEFINPKILEWSWKNCEENVVVPVLSGSKFRLMENNTLERGFRVTWSTPVACKSCEKDGGLCLYDAMKRSFNCTYCSVKREKYRLNQTQGGYDCVPGHSHNSGAIAGVVLGLLTIVIIFVLLVCLRCRKKRRENTAPNVDLFLENYGSLSLQRYRYKDIKKMTNSFKDKLGQGGYGSVFKGKLVDGRLVAVKVLKNDPQKTTNGEEFMNEVATIGRTNHVNIVALLGFCSSGSKRALVYEFMPNGSLEKFIHEKKEKSTTIRTATETTSTSTTTATTTTQHLGWEKLYQISLGIARGLEYLHRGCNTGRILHFDIKPHNILLDENFCPKVSDFGLAKLCPTRDSIVSMLTGGRGTLGYIAPEVYCRNFGGVSYKSDVYSYGMMVLEMVGGRKNIDPFVDNTSGIYFPHWIHDRLQEQNNKNIEDLLRFEGDIEEELAKKMIMVGLWCIQTNPAHRPSMSRVAEMLEGRIEDLRMPPKPIVDLSSPPPPTAL